MEKEKQMRSKVSRKKEIINIRAEINRGYKDMGKINETKSWFYEKINKIDKYLGKLGKKGGYKYIGL